MKRRVKVVVIDECMVCPHLTINSMVLKRKNLVEIWTCDRTQKEIRSGGIPRWCPLKDYKKENTMKKKMDAL